LHLGPHRVGRVEAALAIALLSLLLSQSVPVASAQSTGSTGLTPEEANSIRMNSFLFEATVPNAVYVGENFSVSLLLTNVSNESIPVVVELSTPVDMLYVTPHVHRDSIKPGAAITEIFWMVPIQPTNHAQNVTARVYIWFQDRMAAPALVIQTTTFVFSIAPSPLAPYVAAAIVLVVLAAGASLILLAKWKVVRRRMAPAPPVTPPAQSHLL
jgi:hypothetical protein